jgi:hypothetical protein
MVKPPGLLHGKYTFRRYRKQRKAGSVTSERQKAANQANALHSTGPKSPEGKAAIRFNAFRHGLLAQDAVLPGEDPDAFEDLWNRVRANLSPVGPIEEFLVDRVVNAMWTRISRAGELWLLRSNDRAGRRSCCRLGRRFQPRRHAFYTGAFRAPLGTGTASRSGSWLHIGVRGSWVISDGACACSSDFSLPRPPGVMAPTIA